MSPQLTFACEMQPGPLLELFDDAAVWENLTALGAGVSLGILDLSEERASLVRRLNDAGIPVTAWLLLPIEKGYWFGAYNAPEAFRRYIDFKAWTAEHDLKWDAVGLDIEFDRREVDKLMEKHWGEVLPGILKRTFDNEKLRRVQMQYSALVGQIRADGYTVEAYHFPFIADERAAGSTLMQRVLGIVDVPVDRDVFMLYSSFMGENGPALLWSYGPDADSVGVGSTGGGVDVGDLQIRTLSWEDFARDLRLARRINDAIFIFSLEGCVDKGYLSQLVDFDWDTPVETPETGQVDDLRKLLQQVLWATAHPLLAVAGLGALLWIQFTIKNKLKKLFKSES